MDYNYFEMKTSQNTKIVVLALCSLTVAYWSYLYFSTQVGFVINGKQATDSIYWFALASICVDFAALAATALLRFKLAAVLMLISISPLAVLARQLPSPNLEATSTQTKTILVASGTLQTERSLLKDIGLGQALQVTEENGTCAGSNFNCGSLTEAFYGTNDSLETVRNSIMAKFAKAGWSGSNQPLDTKYMEWDAQHGNLLESAILDFGIATNGQSYGVFVVFFSNDPVSYKDFPSFKPISDKYSRQYQLYYNLSMRASQ
jgi:hypothetical protein